MHFLVLKKFGGGQQSEPGESYFLTYNGQVVELDRGVPTQKGLARITNDQGLEKAIRAILEPLVIADRIERGLARGFDMVMIFDEWKDKFRNAVDATNYNYNCIYDQEMIEDKELDRTRTIKIDGVEDSYTRLRIGKSLDVNVLNPFYRGNITSWFSYGFNFYTTSPPSHSSRARPNM